MWEPFHTYFSLPEPRCIYKSTALHLLYRSIWQGFNLQSAKYQSAFLFYSTFCNTFYILLITWTIITVVCTQEEKHSYSLLTFITFTTFMKCRTTHVLAERILSTAFHVAIGANWVFFHIGTMKCILLLHTQLSTVPTICISLAMWKIRWHLIAGLWTRQGS